MTAASESDMPSFAQNIRPLFREKDRDSMLKSFDLFDHADVSQHAGVVRPNALTEGPHGKRRRTSCRAHF